MYTINNINQTILSFFNDIKQYNFKYLLCYKIGLIIFR